MQVKTDVKPETKRGLEKANGKNGVMGSSTNLEVWEDRQHFHWCDARLAVVFGDLRHVNNSVRLLTHQVYRYPSSS